MLIPMEHYPSTADKQVLQTIIDSSSATANEKIIATAIMNLEHYATAEDKVNLQTVIIGASSTADEKTNAAAVSFAVNENMSVSVGRHEVDMGAGKVDETSQGVSASYVMGSTTIGFVANSTDNVAGTSGSDDSYREIAVSFAF